MTRTEMSSPPKAFWEEAIAAQSTRPATSAHVPQGKGDGVADVLLVLFWIIVIVAFFPWSLAFLLGQGSR